MLYRETVGDSVQANNRLSYKPIKRGIDLLLAFILFIPALILVALCYIFIKMETKGPAFFVQERPGYKEQMFHIYKLRTMKVETERDEEHLTDIDRLTRVGRIIRSLSLDELPQLYNILKGEMSFIGPRPLSIKYLSYYTEEEKIRHNVKPGISGLAQVRGRNNLTWERKFEYDIEYVKNISFLLDLKIFLLTIKKVIIREGIGQAEKAPISLHIERKFCDEKKRLLILGASCHEIDIIHEAHNAGIETIVTDYYLDRSMSPAKNVADFAWDISWTDIDKLMENCKLYCVGGIIAGFSEATVLAARLLCDRLGLPFYAEKEQIQIMSDKIAFKAACIENNISIPKAYEENEKNHCYPVIVKPADNGGSRGITVCYNDNELKVAIDVAKKTSKTAKVLIEDYLVDDEVMVYYTIVNGEVFLSAMCDRYMQKIHRNINQLPVGYYFPSKYLDSFRKQHNDNIINFIKSLNIKNGLLAFQAFMNTESFVPFDPTYRLDGTKAYHFTERMNGINALKMLVNYSMSGTMGDIDYIKIHENPNFVSPCFELPILLKNGIISRIEGLERVDNIGCVIFIDMIHRIGDVLTEKAHFSQMLCRIHIASNSDEELIKNISIIQNNLKVYDEFNNIMNIGFFNANLLRKE